jgi:hypothetical protein
MNTPWLSKFDELAIFNADNDKSKYNNEYLAKMDALQIEYSAMLMAHAKSNGHIVYGSGKCMSEEHKQTQRLHNFRMSEMVERAALGIKYHG